MPNELKVGDFVVVDDRPGNQRKQEPFPTFLPYGINIYEVVEVKPKTAVIRETVRFRERCDKVELGVTDAEPVQRSFKRLLRVENYLYRRLAESINEGYAVRKHVDVLIAEAEKRVHRVATGGSERMDVQSLTLETVQLAKLTEIQKYVRMASKAEVQDRLRAVLKKLVAV